jgi:predicted alpha/beta-hydrolase family hydrolase
METTIKLESVQIPVTPELSVSGVVGVPQWWPTGSRVGLVLAHDSSGSFEDESVVSLHRALTERGYLSIRFNFPYAEQGRRRPDGGPLLERAFRAATASLLRDPQNAPARLVLGGLGLGGRIAAQIVAQGLKADGLLFLSYPLHPAGKPTRQRSDALFRIICPMLFVPGTRDPTCRLDRLRVLLRRIGAPTYLHVVQDGDHAFRLTKRNPRPTEEVEQEIFGAVENFIRVTAGGE